MKERSKSRNYRVSLLIRLG